MTLLMDMLSDTVQSTVDGITGDSSDGEGDMPPPPPDPARTVSDKLNAGMGALGMPLELMNEGFAAVTDGIAQAFPPLPAAFLGCLYLGPPHGHLHPPSYTPPVTPAPIPLPSLGPVVLGTCIQVLINGIPAARAGDLGFAVTCAGFFPLFEVFTGSSKVFIGGSRAARMLDLCRACQPSVGGPARAMSRAMAAAAKAAAVVEKATEVAQVVTTVAGVGADVVDAATASDPDEAAADALSAGLGAAQAALDAATAVLSEMMGRDLAVPPSMGVLMLGAPNVLIGGFPMPNFPDPIGAVVGKLAAKHHAAKEHAKEKEHAPDPKRKVGCPSCPE
jgi:uncharacterized Zn-binding protein involved in type VI secretion